jgi:predicted RNA-binding Zn-ribbon protein involved in translation (DUF1610 family)
MIQARERTLYNVQCDECGMTGPDRFSEKTAVAAARQDGWRIESHWNGLEHVVRHYCPVCEEGDNAEVQA